MITCARGSPASWSAIQRSDSGEMIALAISTRDTPYARATASCGRLASVMAHAPAASWSAHSRGAIVVLPCGARSRPRAAHHPARVATFCRRAGAESVSTGVGNRLRGTRSAITSAGVLPHSSGGKPLSAQLSGRASRAANAAASRTAGSGSGMRTSDRQTTHTAGPRPAHSPTVATVEGPVTDQSTKEHP